MQEYLQRLKKLRTSVEDGDHIIDKYLTKEIEDPSADLLKEINKQIKFLEKKYGEEYAS